MGILELIGEEMKIVNDMKRTFLLGLVLLAGVSVAVACSDDEFPAFHPGDSKKNQQVDSSKTDPGTITAKDLDYTKLTADNHPRVIFTGEEFAAIAAATSANPALKTMHEAIVAQANKTVGSADLERVLTGKRLLSVSRDAEKRILYCAYAYKTTGETKYLTQAEHDIVTVCKFSDWNAGKHFLDVGEMAAGVGLGYDWLYSDLSAETRTLAEKALNDFAFSPAQNKVWNLDFYSTVNNWNQVCNGGLVCAALAVYEKNQTVAKAIIEKAIESNKTAMSSMYAPDGNYPEGYGYWNYGTLYEALMLSAMETAAGSDAGISSAEGFSKTGKYMLFMEGPIKQCFNYSDCASSTRACMSQWYFASKFGDKSVLYLEKDRIGTYSSDDEARLLPLIAHFAYKVNLASLDDIQAPAEKFFRGEGTTPVVLVHSNWAMDNTDKFLGVKAGKANTSHSHMDAGSFVYDALGVRWSADLGLQSYGTLEPYINLWDMNDGSERWTSFRYNNFNHSTITVNEAYHKVSGAATIKGLVNDGTRMGATVDITAPLGNEISSAERTVYMEGDNLIVKDEIKALDGKEAKVRWTMVTRAVPTIEYGGITLKSATGKYMYLTTTSSTNHKPTLKTWSTTSTNSWDAANTGYYECGYEVTVKAGATAVITVKLSPND